MRYAKNIYLEREQIDYAKELCCHNPFDEDECFSSKEAPLVYTADFPNGYSVDVKVCGVDFEEGSDNTAWTEAVLFKNGWEVACTEPCDSIDGPWELSDGDKEFIVNVLCKNDLENTKPIILLVGQSGCGKSTIADILEKHYGLRQVVSYTTRPSRGEGDLHYFVTKEEFAEIKDEMCAYTVFDGNEYGASSDDVELSDVYVIDPAGVRYFIKHYSGKRPFRVFYLRCDDHVCFVRMRARGDTIVGALRRLQNDCRCFTDEALTFDCKSTRIDVTDITASQAARFIMTIVNEETGGNPYYLTSLEEDSVYRKVDRHFLEQDIKEHLKERLEAFRDDENIKAVNAVQELIDDPGDIADFAEHTIEHSDPYYDAYWTCIDYCIDDQIERALKG